MPLTLLQYKTDRGLKELAERLSKELPAIVAPVLTLSDRERLDGQVTPEDIIVWCVEGSKADVNSKDLEIIIWAHDFPERKANLEERKDAIIKGIHQFLADWDRNVTGFVWVLLQPTAFGEI
ncbi:MAG: hypothetical protein HYS78_01690 [Parcubacteria group bacterium]|nr:hypothetical protein [Parcubacteria group bacterium]